MTASPSPRPYVPILSPKQTEQAIRLIKGAFETNLAFELNLTRATAPLFVESGTGINDDLNGVEKPVSFTVRDLGGQTVEVVQSLAKWKRMALGNLRFNCGEGIYTDMNAIRPDETLDHLHSLYVDQWDWELVIEPKDRTLALLERVVRRIYDVIRRVERFVCHEYPEIEPFLPDEIALIHSEDLALRYPSLLPKQREREVCKEHGAVFVIGIGAPLPSGEPHDGRAPDYDDWITPTTEGHRGLNGDILVYNPVLDDAFELSSMGIRVSPESLEKQLAQRGQDRRKELLFHKRLLRGDLPQTMGGGIGQSRLCMLYLHKAHIGEIQASLWPQAMINQCREQGIELL
ncbi:MAG: aspartate--ammonia ligase [Myxococcota bacterium]|jgi:aspartate--ammonia ligase|nr:aspartate--ammonia ligase [Myxococcota bacterium]